MSDRFAVHKPITQTLLDDDDHTSIDLEPSNMGGSEFGFGSVDDGDDDDFEDYRTITSGGHDRRVNNDNSHPDELCDLEAGHLQPDGTEQSEEIERRKKSKSKKKKSSKSKKKKKAAKKEVKEQADEAEEADDLWGLPAYQ
jgi:hypothetical protein